MKRRTMTAHMNALLEDLERSLVIARALRAELIAKTAHMNRRAIDHGIGVHIPTRRLRGARSRSDEHSSSSVVRGGVGRRASRGSRVGA
jgi:hypothetical protein